MSGYRHIIFLWNSMHQVHPNFRLTYNSPARGHTLIEVCMVRADIDLLEIACFGSRRVSLRFDCPSLLALVSEPLGTRHAHEISSQE